MNNNNNNNNQMQNMMNGRDDEPLTQFPLTPFTSNLSPRKSRPLSKMPPKRKLFHYKTPRHGMSSPTTLTASGLSDGLFLPDLEDEEIPTHRRLSSGDIEWDLPSNIRLTMRSEPRCFVGAPRQLFL